MSSDGLKKGNDILSESNAYFFVLLIQVFTILSLSPSDTVTNHAAFVANVVVVLPASGT